MQLHLLLWDLLTAIPERPLLAPWYRLVESEDRLLLEHGQVVVVLEGAAVRTLLPALLPLLDGTRGCEELVQHLGVAVRPAVELAIETLGTHGLLTEGPDVPSGLQAVAHGIASAFALAPAVAAERLTGASVEIVGSSPAAAEIARLLRLSGVAEIAPGRWDANGLADFAIVAPAAEEVHELHSWNAAANEHGLCWLPVLPYDGRFAAIGPLVVPGESCCYECVLRRRAANVEYGAHLYEIERAPTAARADPPFATLIAAVAAHLALRWLGGQDRSLPGVLYAVESRPTLSIGEHPVLRVPRCPVCSPAERLAAPLPWHEASSGEEMVA